MKLSHAARFAVVPALVLFGALAEAGSARAEDKVLAKINGVEIRESDLALAEAEVGAEVANIPAPNRRRLLLEFLIEMQLYSNAAEGEKLTSGPEFERRLAYWNTRAKRDAYYEKAVREAIGESVVRALYDEKVKELTPEEEVEASHILVETEEQAQALADQARDGGDFAKLAAEHSNDPGSKANGGKLGFFGKGQMVKEFDEAAFSLEKGEISKPVKSQFGWHVIKVEDRRMKPVPTFEEVKGQISHAMEQQKGQQVSKELRDKATIEYVDSEIREQVEKEVAAQAARQQMFDQQMNEQLQKQQDQQKLENEAK